MSEHHTRRDRGSVLPLVLVITVALGGVVVAIASYATTSLRYGGVAEDRSDRLSAADAGMRYAIDQLKLRNAACILDTQEATLPGVEADFNDATASVVCQRITSGFEGIQAYAAVMTGQGLASGQALLSTQGGNSTPKVLGGPVYMSRIDSQAFDLSPQVTIENGPLLYYDNTAPTDQPCRSKKPSEVAPVAAGTLVFDPELIFGPACVRTAWTEIWDSPVVPILDDLDTYPLRDGAVSLDPDIGDPDNGSYLDVGSGGDTCRVFYPGNYATPPDQANHAAYFMSGDYVFDFQGADQKLLIQKGVVVAGKPNPAVPTSTANELEPDMSIACKEQQADDPATTPGATFYLAGGAHIDVNTQGSLEIHARAQGDDYVSVQTLCDPAATWCNADGDGGLAGKQSTLRAPANSPVPPVLYTNSGNNREFIAHAYFYAPLAEIEFGNVTNTATQKMLGGLVAARLELQSSASASNFEIAVPTSPITAKIQLTSTAEKNESTTSARAVVEYRPYEEDIDDRVRVNSWRVCEGPC